MRRMFRYRVLMLDLARQMERREQYEFWLPWLKEWGYNALHLHLTDDEGCAVVFPRRPELATAGAFSADDMRRFVAKARKHGIDVIPEVESLGHARFITRHARYRELAAPPPPGREGHNFNALRPEHPETRRVLRDLFRDAAELFESPILHVGLDEVDLSALVRKGRPAWWAFAGHAAWVHEMVRKTGRRPAMWADHAVRSPDMLASFERDVLMVDWNYEAGVRADSLDVLGQAGFEAWAAPATMWWRVRLLTNPQAFANVREFTGHALRRRQGVSGMVNTVWCPYRYLPGAMDWPIAWAGHVFRERQERSDFALDFCRSFYGLTKGAAVPAALALEAVHAAAPAAGFYDDVVAEPTARFPRFTREHQRQCRLRVPIFAQAGRDLARAARQARRNAERLYGVVLSARILERWARYGASGLRQPMRVHPGARKAGLESWSRCRILPPDIDGHQGQNALRMA